MGGVTSGGPVVGPEPHRHHGGRGDGSVGDGLGDSVVPEQRVAVLHRGAAGPDVAPLDREVTGLLVLGHPDEGAYLVHGGGGGGHATIPSRRSSAMRTGSTPA